MREIAPAHEEHWFEVYGRIARTGNPECFENYAWQLERHFDVYAFRLGAPAQRRVAILFNDITDRRRAKHEAREHEVVLKEAQRLARIGSWSWDMRTDSNQFSDELCRIFGLPSGHSVPNFQDQDGTFYPHESWLKLSAAVREALRTRSGYTLDLPAPRNGEPIWVTSRSEIVTNASNEVIGLRGTVQDITDRKQAEDALRHAESLLRVITDALPTLIAYVDLDGIYRLNNHAYEEWFKHTRQEITGRHMRDVLGEAAWQIIRPQMDAAFAGETVTFEAEVNYKEAGKRWINPTYVPHVGTDGQVQVVAVPVRDVTQQKHIEAALRASEPAPLPYSSAELLVSRHPNTSCGPPRQDAEHSRISAR